MFFIVYVSLADEQDMGGGGPDVVLCHDQEEHSWLQDRGQSSSPKIYIDALRISALAFSSILLLLVIEEKEEHEPLASC